MTAISPTSAQEPRARSCRSLQPVMEGCGSTPFGITLGSSKPTYGREGRAAIEKTARRLRPGEKADQAAATIMSAATSPRLPEKVGSMVEDCAACQAGEPDFPGGYEARVDPGCG